MRKNGHFFYSRFKVWSRNWVPSVRFTIESFLTFWQLSHVFGHFRSIIYCAWADTATSPFLISYRTWNLTIRPTRCLGQFLLNRLLHMDKNSHFLLPVKFLTENLKFSWPDSYSTTKFGGTCGKIYARIERKTAVIMQNSQNLGTRGWRYPFLTETPKRHIFGRFRAFWAIVFLDQSAGFAATREYKKGKV